MRYEIVIAEPDPQTGEAEKVVATTRRYNGAVNEFERYITDAYANMVQHGEGDHIVGGNYEDWDHYEDSYFIGHFDKDWNLMRYRRIFIRRKV